MEGIDEVDEDGNAYFETGIDWNMLLRKEMAKGQVSCEDEGNEPSFA